LRFCGLAAPGDGKAEYVCDGGDGAEAMLSAREPMLVIRFSVFRGLGAEMMGSLEGAFRGSVTESIEERLALLPWVPLIT
jgi:hypothetical protein